MTRKDALAELIAKVGAGDNIGFRRANRAVFSTPCQDMSLQLREEHARHAYKGSLDAAKALHEAVLPRMYWNLSEWDGAWSCQIPVSTFKRYEATSEHSPARAWLLAILRALHSMEKD